MDLGQAVPGQAVRGQAALKEWVEITSGFGCSTSSLFLGCSVGWGTMAGVPACHPQVAPTTESRSRPLGLRLASYFCIFPFLSHLRKSHFIMVSLAGGNRNPERLWYLVDSQGSRWLGS